MDRILATYPEKCDGCGDCARACEVIAPGRASRIRLIGLADEQVWVPVVCQHCESPQCALVCPTGAMARNEATGFVDWDEARCVGCKMCMVACPAGAIRFDREAKKVMKCDLCGGAPACVKVCKMGALGWSGARMIGHPRRVAVVERLLRMVR